MSEISGKVSRKIHKSITRNKTIGKMMYAQVWAVIKSSSLNAGCYPMLAYYNEYYGRVDIICEKYPMFLVKELERLHYDVFDIEPTGNGKQLRISVKMEYKVFRSRYLNFITKIEN